ncbi:MAG: type IV secretory system conjugative DNA transfer family protein [Terricaulis sp.]
MRSVIVLSCCFVIVLAASSAATQYLAHVFGDQPALGRAWVTTPDGGLYAPWAVFEWSERWSERSPKPFAIARLIVLAGFALSLVVAAAALRQRLQLKPFGKEAWAKFEDIQAAGLFAEQGAILGKFDGEILAYDGAGHQILIGASRSGKGRGHVVPTLLSWGGSALVLDVKGELDSGDSRHGFPGTSGHRAAFGPVLRFAPTLRSSNGFNPLMEIRRGENEVRDVQNVVDIIVEPHGATRGGERFWNDSAKNILTGLILHVLYAEPPERKTLAAVREKLADLDRTTDEMRLTLHRLNPRTNAPEVHPEVLHAATSYLSGEERLRSHIKATAESFFGMFADPIIAEKTSQSDFRIGDLMCAERPVTLYLQPPPSDAPRLMPLMRLLIAQVARTLMEDQIKDGHGRDKRHRLLLMLDEFPQLGRLDFFEKMMGAMAGYGLKAFLVCQSLNHVIKAYGRDNVILDNCHCVTSFAAADPETAKHIADMAGEVWEMRPQESEHRPRSILGPRKGAITYREERRPLILPGDVRGLPQDEQLIFVSGCKPIRAKKLRFDRERIFVNRLRPAAASAAAGSPDSDWRDVRALGRLVKEKKPVTLAKRQEPPPPPRAQADLFDADDAAAAPPAPPPAPAEAGPKLSELALAAFRNPDGSPRTEPPRSKGI